MCLIVFAWQAHPRYRLILAANRDEYFDRPTSLLDYWTDQPQVLGGRDMERGGSWLASNVDGRWAAVTNFRDGGTALSDVSRGHLVSNYVASPQAARDYTSETVGRLDQYAGCNLLVGDAHGVFFLSNRLPAGAEPGMGAVTPGIHGLSNHLLNTPWPKVQRSKSAMQALLQRDAALEPDELFRLLADRRPAGEAELPATGVPHEWERTLSAPFIVADGYGTRASTVILLDHAGHAIMEERSFGAGGVELDRRAVWFDASAATSGAS
jgi:uncharacterized protein with NRDE domain